jgi:hypothetical protein
MGKSSRRYGSDSRRGRGDDGSDGRGGSGNNRSDSGGRTA